jgi:purine-nucleoside phosphorylase
MPTPHISAVPGDYAPTVLMPGDPLRAAYIAENFLDDARQVNAVRNMFGYTGTYRGQPVSVQASGMGVPSIQIYATELARFYGVERIVRVGSCGTVQPTVALRDLVVALAAGTDSLVNRARFAGRDFPAAADWSLVRAMVEAAERAGHPFHVGSVYTSDFFYEPEGSNTFALLQRYGVLAVEMEAAGLYGVAAECGIAALTVATVTDHIIREESLSSEERQSGLASMLSITLDALFP